MRCNSLSQTEFNNNELIIGEKFMKENKRGFRH